MPPAISGSTAEWHPSQELLDRRSIVLAVCLALLERESPDLGAVVRARPELPETDPIELPCMAEG